MTARDHRVLVIGAGQHGLSASYWLRRRGIRHAVLERGELGSSWLGLWDSFRTNTPKAFNRLPGAAYDGPDPHGFSTREEIAGFLADYARANELPVHEHTPVLRADSRGGRFRVDTPDGTWTSDALIVATGQYGNPRLPRFRGRLPSRVRTLHSTRYRNARELPDGAVLVVGGGQSGAQIAEDLRDAGRTVYLSLSDRPCNLRRYRGRDFMELWEAGGILHERLEDHALIRRGDPHAKRVLRSLDFPLVSGTGADGRGHSISLRGLAESGITLLGPLAAADGELVRFRDLRPYLRTAHAATREIRAELAAIAERCYRSHELEPPEALPDDLDWEPADSPRTLGLRQAGVSTVVFCTGFDPDWSWLALPHVFDEMGYPLGPGGVSPHPGLYFLGLFFLRRLSTTCLCNGGQDALEIVAHADRFLSGPGIAAPPQRRGPRPARRVAVVLPTPQDQDELAALEGPELVIHSLADDSWSPYMSAAPRFDVAAFTARCIRHAMRHGVDAVLASHDLGALVAAAVSDHAGLPGPGVEAAFRCSHKAYSRAAERDPIGHRAYALDADVASHDAPLPAHVKPASLMFSILQGAVGSREELERAVRLIRREGRAFNRPFREFGAQYVDTVRYPLADRDVVLVEEIVEGASQHAVEGFTDAAGRHSLWAISDNAYHAGRSPALDANIVPSAVDGQTAGRLVEVAFDTITRHRLRGGFWNVELWIRPDGRIQVTEVNGRMIASMTPLYRAVLGRSQYPAAVALACGDAAGARATGPREPRGVGGMFSIASRRRGGRVRDVIRWSELQHVRRMEGVIKLALMQTPDTEISWTQTGGAFCVARAYVVGPDEPTIRSRATEIRERLIDDEAAASPRAA